MSDQTVGSWSPLRPLNPQDEAVFKEVTSQLIGANYQALDVRTQVVNGLNYQFVANQTIPGYSELTRVAIAVYAPAGGTPSIVSIKNLLLD